MGTRLIKILMVDDNYEDLGELLDYYFREKGLHFSLHGVTNNEEALDILSQKKFDLIITDTVHPFKKNDKKIYDHYSGGMLKGWGGAGVYLIKKILNQKKFIIDPSSIIVYGGNADVYEKWFRNLGVTNIFTRRTPLDEFTNYIIGSKLCEFPTVESKIIPEVITDINSEIMEYLYENPDALYNIKSDTFEKIIAELFATEGYSIELTKKTRDSGVDFYTIKDDFNIPIKFLVQCKRYQLHKKVNVALINELYGVKTHEKVSKAILVTTSTYTKPAIKFANAHYWELDLKDMNDIIRWFENYMRRKKKKPGL